MSERVVHASGRPVRRSGVSDLLLDIESVQRVVSGESMQPTLSDGDHVLVVPCSRAEVGDIVLCRHPYRRDTRIIKRVSAADEHGMTLIGDNAGQTRTAPASAMCLDHDWSAASAPDRLSPQ